MNRNSLVIVIASFVVCAAGASSDGGATPVRSDEFAVDLCVRGEHSCSPLLAESVQYARTACDEVGGTLQPAPEPDIFSLDVDRDGIDEYLFEVGAIVYCEGAASLFSCGSLGCPKGLYQRRAAGFRVIGSIYADPVEGLTVLDSGVLRTGCYAAPCSEYRFYEWIEDHYESTFLEVRGHRVEFANSVHGLFALRADTDVAAVPEGGQSVGRYAAGTEVAIIGTLSAGGYYYVSPCNACESGFVPLAAVTAP